MHLERIAQLKEKLPLLRAAGAADITLDVLVAYRGQCNLEFSAEEFAILASVGLPLALTCYETSEDT
ncbi:MAG: hypothetical protein L0Y66_15740 [Myxococcaceae bacterium]|nr:hypothetical protein [Myxococcaceae bacterium]MCI0668865.1 hypothetical protein [Myxococcaceae bacterium]